MTNEERELKAQEIREKFKWDPEARRSELAELYRGPNHYEKHHHWECACADCQGQDY